MSMKHTAAALAACLGLIAHAGLAQAAEGSSSRGTLKDGSSYEKTMEQAGMSGMSGMSGMGGMEAKAPEKKAKAKAKKAKKAKKAAAQ